MIHLVVPGLLWPKDAIAELTRGLDLPALRTLLGRARCVRRPAQPAEHWLCEVFGVSGAAPPIGALRLLGEGLDPGSDTWLCVDPVHLRIARDTVRIDAAGPRLDAEQAQRLAAALNAELAEFGEFLAPHPRRWYLRAKHAPHLATPPPSAIAGRTLAPFLPQGDAARHWRRLINEAQVLLHNHPLDGTQEEDAPANGLWPWGAGRLPAAACAPAPRVFADHPLARGLARLAAVPVLPVPDRYEGAVAPALTFLETLDEAAQRLDEAAWRDGLARLETDWFAPLLAALKARRLQRLRLTALGDDALVDVTLEAGDLWRFWLRPKTLADLLK
jgi:hypothetical protein